MSDDLKVNSLQGLVQQVTSQSSMPDTMMNSLRYGQITLNRSLLTELYQEHGLIGVMIDQPVDDAFRGGVDVYCDELSGDDISELQDYLERDSIVQTYGQGIKWCRLFGGGGVVINAGQNMGQPFKIEKIEEWTPLTFLPVDRWELGLQVTGNLNDQLTAHIKELPYDYYGHRIHKSNVIRLMGREAPSLIRGMFSGWGVSELERLVRSFNAYLKHQNIVFELLDEAKIDVFSIQGFNSALATKQGTELTAQRIQLAAKLKSFQNALALDKEDAYEQKQISFGGLSEILGEIRKGIACDMRMPLTKLFGISASGFNAGDDDIENYNVMIETEIRSKYRTGLNQILRICCQKLFGFVPETLRFNYKPLRLISHKDESEMKTQGLNRVLAAFQNGLMASDNAVEQLNKEAIFKLDIPVEAALDLEELKEIRQGEDPPVVPSIAVGTKVVTG